MNITKIYNQIIAQPTKFYVFAVQDVAKYCPRDIALSFYSSCCHYKKKVYCRYMPRWRNITGGGGSCSELNYTEVLSLQILSQLIELSYW